MAGNDTNSWMMQKNGDVSIFLGGDHRYVLQSSLLRKHSPFFAKILTDESTPIPNKRTSGQVKIRWRLELVERPDPGVIAAGVLELLTINEKSQIIPQDRRCPVDHHEGLVSNPIYRHYERVFGTLYGEQFSIEDDEHMTTTINDILGLMEVAEYLGCMSNIARTVETAMLNKGVKLFQSVAGNPCIWAKLAYRVHSNIVFKEAIVHLVGRWQDPDLLYRDQLLEPIRKVIMRLHMELTNRKRAIELKIAQYSPAQTKRDPDQNSKLYNRNNYSQDIFEWMAGALFKQWFASAVVQNKHRIAQDGGFWLYNKLAAGGYAYLTDSELVEYHQNFPLSQKGRSVFQQSLFNVKQDIRVLVKPLLRNESELDPKEMGLQYLTCTVVEKKDMPWLQLPPKPLGPGAGHKHREVERAEEETELGEKRRRMDVDEAESETFGEHGEDGD